MNKQDLVDILLEEIAWQKELIEDALVDNELTEFEKQWLDNMIKYYRANQAKLKKLLRE